MIAWRRRVATRCSGMLCLLLLLAAIQISIAASSCTDIFHLIRRNSDQRILGASETDLFAEARENITLACFYAPQNEVSATWEITPAPSNVERFNKSHSGSLLSIQWTAALVTDSAVYECIYTLQNQQNVSCPHNLTIEEPISTPNISSPGTVLEGDSLTLSCSVQGVPLPTITWYKDGELLSPPSSNLSVLSQPYGITEHHTLPSVTCADTGNYSCSAVQVLQSRGGEMLVLNSSVSTYTVSSVPMVTISAESLTALVNSNITLVCTITQDCLSLPVTILWSHHGVASLMNTTKHIITTTSDSESSLTLIQVDPSFNDRDYTCTATTSAGTNNATVTLTIQASPSINTTGGLVQIDEGASISLECLYDGLPSPPSDAVEWYHNGTMVTSPRASLEIINATSYRSGIPAFTARLTIINASYCDNGNYSCQVTNEVGPTASLQQPYSLLVSTVPMVSISAAQSLTALVNSNITLVCTITQDCLSLPVTILWSHHGVASLVNTTKHIITTTSDSESSLTLIQVDPSVNDRDYTCTVITSAGTNNATVTLTIQASPSINTTGGLVQIDEGASISLECLYDGLPSPPSDAVEWYHNGTMVTGPRVSLEIINAASYRSGIPAFIARLTIINASYCDNGNYSCQVTNGVGPTASLQQPYSLLVSTIPMVSISAAESLTALVNSNITLVCTITQDCLSLPVTILWSHHGVASLVNTTKHIITTTSDSESSLTLIQVDPSFNDRDYTCTVTTSAGTNNATVTLTIQASPSINTTGGLVQIDEGASISLECLYDGLPSPPSDAVEWYHNGELVIGIISPRLSLEIINAASYRSGIPAFTARLTITDIKPSGSGNYSCQVSNEVSPIASLQQPYFLSVIKPDYCSSSPCLNGATCRNELSSFLCDCAQNWIGLTCDEEQHIKSAPVIDEPLEQQYVPIGSTVNLTCVARGNPQPTITWFHNNEVITGAVTSLYVIDQLDLATRGQYKCRASNDLGTITSDTVIVKIRGLLQYKIEVKFTRGFVIRSILKESILNESDSVLRKRAATSDQFNFTATTERLETLISILSRLDQKKVDNGSATIIKVQFTPNNTIKSLLDDIPLLVSVIVADVQNLMVNSQELKNALLKVIDGFISSIVRFDACPQENITIPSQSGDPSLAVILSWPETDAGRTSILVCPCGPPGFNISVVRSASRLCWSDFVNVAEWRSPDDSSCDFSDAARRLCNLARLEREDELANGLDSITGMTEQIKSLEVSISTTLVERLANGSTIGNRSLSDPFLNVIDNLLAVPDEELIDSNNEAKSSARLLESFDTVIASYPVTDNFTILRRQNYVTSISLIDTSSNEGSIFSINQGSASLNDKSKSTVGATITVHLPSSIYDTVKSALNNGSSGNTDVLRLTQGAFSTTGLFLRANESSHGQPRVDGVIAMVDFPDVEVSGLSEPVVMTFSKNTGVGNGTLHNQTRFTYSCKYWEPGDRESYGYWSSRGCRLVRDTNDTATCECDHLTSFCILLDVAPVESPEGEDDVAEAFLSTITITGCCVSSVCLIVIIITYTVEKKLRKTTNGRLLVNLSFALLGLYVIFILAVVLSSVKPLCIVTAVLLHYFFLASFLAMAGESVVLYIELVKVFQSEIHYLVLKTAIVTWVTPVFISVLVLAPNPNGYSGEVCQPLGVQFWVGYVVPFCGIYLFNFILFVVIICSISRQQAKMSGATGNKDLELTFRKRLVISITLSILFGLGWGIGLASTRSLSVNYLRYSFQIIFILLCAFQGLFIFIAYGLRLEKVRLAWLKWFYIAVGKHNKALSIATRDTVKFSTRAHHNVTLGTFADSGAESVELKKFGAVHSSPSLSHRSNYESSPYTCRRTRRQLSPLARKKHTASESTKNGSLKPPEWSNNNRLLVPPSRGHSPSLAGSISTSSFESSTFNTETDRETPNTERNTPHSRDTLSSSDKDTTSKDTYQNGIDITRTNNDDSDALSNHKDTLTKNDRDARIVCHTPV